MNLFITILKKTIAYFIISTIVVIVLFRIIPPPVNVLMLRRLVDQTIEGKPLRLQKDWVPIDKMSPNIVQAVIASEDNNFPIHRGIDFQAIQKARQINKFSRRLHGASTISQQTAKNVFLWPQRSYIRKGMEVYFTVMIEIFWSKKRIMEVYLNIVELGNGIYGVEAASQYYFHKKSLQLTANEAALLASILPSPLKRNPASPNAYLLNRKEHIRNAMIQLGRVEL